jgi:hypothetical protein
MATFRCPECGASHKEQVRACRLCGAPMEEAVLYRNVTVDDSMSADRFKSRGLWHFAAMGVLAAVVVVAGAFALGAADNPTLERWAQRLPFVDGPVGDAWFAWADPDAVFIVDLPARPVSDDASPDLDLGAPTSTWQTSIGLSQFTIGITDGLDYSVPEGINNPGPTIRVELQEAIERLADQQDVQVVDVGDAFSVNGRTAVDALLDGFRVSGGPAFGSVRAMMVDGEILFVQTVDVARNPEMHRRLRSSVVVVADDPDTTIPTIPEDAPGPGGLTVATDD